MVNLIISPTHSQVQWEISERGSVPCGLNVLWDLVCTKLNFTHLAIPVSSGEPHRQFPSVQFHLHNRSNLLPSTALLWKCSHWKSEYLAPNISQNRVFWGWCACSAVCRRWEADWAVNSSEGPVAPVCAAQSSAGPWRCTAASPNACTATSVNMLVGKHFPWGQTSFLRKYPSFLGQRALWCRYRIFWCVCRAPGTSGITGTS